MKKLKRTINTSIIIYIVGCVCFMGVALASIWLGYDVMVNYGKHALPSTCVLLSIAGCLLLWEMVKAFRFKVSLPKDFRLITANDFPALFAIINEVTTTLHLVPISRVYIAPGATAAVFIHPQLRNLLFEPKRNLVIGMGFLTQMDDDEIKAILYHEFGHYVQEEMKHSLSVYTVGQFFRSFVSIKEMKKESTLQQQMKSQILLFTYFAIWVCNRINKAYAQLAKQMEYNADDVAAKYVGATTLGRTLLHAACIKYNYDVLCWGLKQLQRQNIGVENRYLSLYYVGQYARPSRKLLPKDVLKRVERLGNLDYEIAQPSTTKVQTSAMRMSMVSLSDKKQVCSDVDFAQWLREGFAVYNRQKELETAVLLEIHLEKGKHKLPLVDVMYKVMLDGKTIGRGNLLKGYTIQKRTSPGKHKVSVYAPSGIITTPFNFEVEAHQSYRIDMDYKVHFSNGCYEIFADSIKSLA